MINDINKDYLKKLDNLVQQLQKDEQERVKFINENLNKMEEKDKLFFEPFVKEINKGLKGNINLNDVLNKLKNYASRS